MRLIAHRGFANRYPENTVLAVREAARVADWVEFDVRRCGSGELVVVHDPTVDRVTDGAGRVAELGLGELQALSVCGSGEPIPTLSEVFAAVPAAVGLNVELKEREIAADVLALAADVDNEVLVSSFDPDVLQEAREAAPGVDRGLLFRDEHDPGKWLGRARDLDCAAILPHHGSCSPAFVERAHEVGLAVYAWTVAERETARKLADAGVDGISADDPDVI